ncbi:MAG: four helix bundle protein [Phycisphaerales bacterium]|nr:four helix bundle protein [Phycisphaerales bacterium]
MAKQIKTHLDLDVYQRAYAASMEIFRMTREFPREEVYSLTSQILRSSRSVTANITAAWRKRRYEGAFVSKLSDAEEEAAETQTWLQYSVDCGFAQRQAARELYRKYDGILRTLVGMIQHPETWIIGPPPSKPPKPG